MSELTPEDKRRIYEEEKTRIEAQQQIKRKISRKTKPSTWGCLVLIILLGIVIGITALRKPSDTGSDLTIPKREEVELKVFENVTPLKVFDWVAGMLPDPPNLAKIKEQSTQTKKEYNEKKKKKKVKKVKKKRKVKVND